MNFNLDDREKALLKSVAVALLTVVAMLFGFEVRPIAQPAPVTSGVGVRDIGESRFSGIMDDGRFAMSSQSSPHIVGGQVDLSVWNSGETSPNLRLTNAGALTVATSIAAPSMGVGSTDTFSGSTHYGITTSVATNSVISHGFSTTPTVLMLFAGYNFTPSVSVGAVNFTILTSQTLPTLQWYAGK